MSGIVRVPEPEPLLVRRAARGERDALKDLLSSVAPLVQRWALAWTGDGDEAADLAQDVLILVARRLPSYRGESRFTTWLFTVTRNQALEMKRKMEREKRKVTRLKIEVDGAVGPAREGAEERDRARIRQMVALFLSELPPRQREVFALAELQGMTGPEVGEILGLDAGAVRAALFKARRALRRRILQNHPEVVEEYLP